MTNKTLQAHTDHSVKETMKNRITILEELVSTQEILLRKKDERMEILVDAVNTQKKARADMAKAFRAAFDLSKAWKTLAGKLARYDSTDQERVELFTEAVENLDSKGCSDFEV